MKGFSNLIKTRTLLSLINESPVLMKLAVDSSTFNYYQERSEAKQTRRGANQPSAPYKG